MGQYDALGIWNIDEITLQDKAGNKIPIYNSKLVSFSGSNIKDLSAGGFEVIGTFPDITPPTFNSVSVDRNIATAGENVKVTVRAQDDISGISNIFVHYISPVSYTKKVTELSDNKDSI